MKEKDSADSGEYNIRLTLTGNSSVGKTQLLRRYSKQEYGDKPIPTIGIDFYNEFREVNGENLKIQIIDTAGQEKFRSISKMYYQTSHGIVLVFDLTNRKSFDDLNFWFGEVKQFAKVDAKILLIGNKSDLAQNRVVSEKEAADYANKNGFYYMETSALDLNDSVEKAFNLIILSCLDMKLSSKRFREFKE